MVKRKANTRCCEPGEIDLSSDGSADRLAQLAWAVAHPARVRILRLLIEREVCICGEIVDRLPLAQSTVSQHLKILRDAELIQGEMDGPRVCYHINRDKLQELKTLIANL